MSENSWTENRGPEGRTPYPLRVDGALEPSLSRGLWLVKWLLLIPHLVVLAFLWLAFTVLTVVVFFAILVTGRYPRAIFDFNVGVLRWTWRVQHYGYGALGTDRYPPFTLADVPDYPAHLDVVYPERLSRGLVLVKWWLLAIPHYLVVAVFVGGGIWLGTWGSGSDANRNESWGAGGLVALLVVISGFVLLFTGRYPRQMYDFVLGMDRWALRVAAYTSLMTDRYPPFRLDTGGPDPDWVHGGPPTPTPTGTGAAAMPPAPVSAVPASAAYPPAAGPGRWTAGRVVAVVIGAVLLFASTGLLLAGGGLLWAHQTQRSGDYLLSPRNEVSTSSYALTSDGIVLNTGGADWIIDNFIGRARLEASSLAAGTPLFLGVARTQDVAAYLRGVDHSRVRDLGPGWGMGPGMMTQIPGGAPSAPPADQNFWVASVTGTGTQVLDWRPRDGNWTVVVMRADARAGIDVRMRVGATAPGLPWLAGGLLVSGGVLALVGALLVAVGAHRASAVPAVPAAPGGPPQIPGARTAPAEDRTGTGNRS